MITVPEGRKKAFSPPRLMERGYEILFFHSCTNPNACNGVR